MTAQAIAGTCSGKGTVTGYLIHNRLGGSLGFLVDAPLIDLRTMRGARSGLPTRLNAAKPPQTTGQLWPIKSI